MTLLQAWRTKDAIVVHADSQETSGDYRVTVNKIASETIGQFSVVVAAAGQPGVLLDSFPTRLKQGINSTVSSIEDFEIAAEQTLKKFYATDIYLCSDPDKNAIFLIGAFHEGTKKYQAWISKNIVLVPIPNDEPTLLGWDEPLYKNIAKRLFSAGMSTAQAVLAGVYVSTIGEATSQYIHRPFKVAIIRDNGIWMEREEYVQEMAERLRKYESLLNQLFLACADTSISDSDFKKSIETFSQSSVLLHRSHLDKFVEYLGAGSIFSTNDLYPKMPVPSLFHVDAKGKVTLEHDPKEQERANQEFLNIVEVLKKEIDFCCAECGNEYKFSISSLQLSDWNCPNCRSAIKTIGRVCRFKKLADTEWTRVE